MCRVVPPEVSSLVYSKRQLSSQDWAQVLAWARSMESILRNATVSPLFTVEFTATQSLSATSVIRKAYTFVGSEGLPVLYASLYRSDMAVGKQAIDCGRRGS